MEITQETARMQATYGRMSHADLILECERLRKLNKEMFEALDAMTTWMPSGFAPQSQTNAMQKAYAVMEMYRINELAAPNK